MIFFGQVGLPIIFGKQHNHCAAYTYTDFISDIILQTPTNLIQISKIHHVTLRKNEKKQTSQFL